MNEELKKELERQQEDSRDKLFEAQLALWNALLTVNGLTLAVFGVVYATAPKSYSYLVVPIIGASMVSVCLLILNFVARKYTHQRIHAFMMDTRALTADVREHDLKQTLWRHWSINFAETASIALFLCEIIFIAVFLWSYRGT